MLNGTSGSVATYSALIALGKTGFYRSNTADCDFNNADEGKGYWAFFVERVLK